MEKKIFLLVLLCLCVIATFIGCHKDPLDLGKAGMLNLSLKQGNRTSQKSAIESFDARVTIYYGADDTVAYNCRFVDPDDDGLFTNDPTVLDCIYIRRDIEFTVGVWAVIQGDTVVGMSDGTNPLYFTGDTDFLDVLIVLMSGYPRVVLKNIEIDDNDYVNLYGELIEGKGNYINFFGWPSQMELDDAYKCMFAKNIIPIDEMLNILFQLDSVDSGFFIMWNMGYDIDFIDDDSTKVVGKVDLYTLDSTEYSVVALAQFGGYFAHSSIEKVTLNGLKRDYVYIDEPQLNGDTVTLHGRYDGNVELNECGFWCYVVRDVGSYYDTNLLQSLEISSEFSYKTKLPPDTYEFYAYVKANNGREWYSSTKQLYIPPAYSQPTGYENGHGYVDMGLPSGTLWAYTNVGANNPEDYGNYYAWGETEPKETYDWSTYRYCNGRDSTLTKYCNNESYGNEGFTDSLTILEAVDDAATVNWGDNWRMPTSDEMQELIDNCDTTWTRQNGINGILFSSRTNDKSIFLPAAGLCNIYGFVDVGWLGYYWSSSLGSYVSRFALDIYFASNYCDVSSDPRDQGGAVRPVCVQSKK